MLLKIVIVSHLSKHLKTKLSPLLPAYIVGSVAVEPCCRLYNFYHKRLTLCLFLTSTCLFIYKLEIIVQTFFFFIVSKFGQYFPQS